MYELFISECRRFRKAAFIAAGVHLTLLLVISRLTLVMQMDWRQHFVLLMAYGLAGAIFGVYQFVTYRQPARWMWLMHRPLPRWRISAALAGASALMIFCTIGVPGLLMLVVTKAATSRVVDLHHYAIILYVTLFTMSCWLCGSYVALSRSKLAIVLLFLPYVLMLHLASAWTMVAVGVFCVLLLAAIGYFVMKPNRFAPPEGAAATIATALPLQIGFYFALLWVGGVASQYLMIMAGTHPLNSAMPPAGGFVEASRTKDHKLFGIALKLSSDPHAAQWAAELPAARLTPVDVAYTRFPLRHELAAGSTTVGYEGGSNGIWAFSHDKMRFVGMDMYTGAPLGELGLDGSSHPFATPPVLELPGMHLVLPQQVRMFDARARRWQAIMQLRSDETIIGARTRIDNPKPQQEYVLTTKRLVAWRPVAHPLQLASERYSIPMPGNVTEIRRVDVATLADGELVSFVFGRNTIDGAATGKQVLMHVDAGGNILQVAERPLAHDYPVLFEHRAWWLSPPLQALLALPDVLIDQGETLPFDAVRLPRPPAAWATVAILSLLSAVGAWWWLRAAPISQRKRAAWIAACFIIGLPSLLCLLVMQERLSPAVRARLRAGLPQAA